MLQPLFTGPVDTNFAIRAARRFNVPSSASREANGRALKSLIAMARDLCGSDLNGYSQSGQDSVRAAGRRLVRVADVTNLTPLSIRHQPLRALPAT